MKNVLDPQKRGYIDFATFSKRFGVSMSGQINVQDNELHLPNLVPNKDKLNEYGTKASTLRATVKEVTNSFKPEVDSKLVIATRFSAKPSHPNTFMNHYAGAATPGFQSESDRFRVAQRGDRTLQMKCDFQQDEASKKNAI